MRSTDGSGGRDLPGRSPSLRLHASRTDRSLQRPEELDIIDVPEPTPGPGRQLYDVPTPGLNFADTHQALSRETDQRHLVTGQ